MMIQGQLLFLPLPLWSVLPTVYDTAFQASLFEPSKTKNASQETFEFEMKANKLPATFRTEVHLVMCVKC